MSTPSTLPPAGSDDSGEFAIPKAPVIARKFPAGFEANLGEAKETLETCLKMRDWYGDVNRDNSAFTEKGVPWKETAKSDAEGLALQINFMRSVRRDHIANKNETWWETDSLKTVETDLRGTTAQVRRQGKEFYKKFRLNNGKQFHALTSQEPWKSHNFEGRPFQEIFDETAEKVLGAVDSKTGSFDEGKFDDLLDELEKLQKAMEKVANEAPGPDPKKITGDRAREYVEFVNNVDAVASEGDHIVWKMDTDTSKYGRTKIITEMMRSLHGTVRSQIHVLPGDPPVVDVSKEEQPTIREEVKQLYLAMEDFLKDLEVEYDATKKPALPKPVAKTEDSIDVPRLTALPEIAPKKAVKPGLLRAIVRTQIGKLFLMGAIAVGGITVYSQLPNKPGTPTEEKGKTDGGKTVHTAPKEASNSGYINEGVRISIEGDVISLVIPNDRVLGQDVEIYVATLHGADAKPENRLKITQLFTEGNMKVPLSKLPDVYKMDGQRVGFVAGVRDGSKSEGEQWKNGFPKNTQGKTAYIELKVR